MQQKASALALRVGAARRAALASLLGVLCASVAAAGGGPELPAPDVILYNALVYTAEPGQPYADAVALRGDRILAVGTLPAVERAAGPTVRRVDLHGKFLMPGMIDSHTHPMWSGPSLVLANFPDFDDSIPKLLAFLRERIRTKDSYVDGVLVVYNVDTGYWVDAARLDRLLSKGPYGAVPIVLFGSDGHTAWANKRARERAGITAEFVRGLTTEERRYYGTGAGLEPNGFTVDDGETKIDRSVQLPHDILLAGGRAAIRYMNEMGITAWLEPSVCGGYGNWPPCSQDPGYLPLYRELGQNGELSAHVAVYPVVWPDRGLGELDMVEKLQREYRDVPNLVVAGIKIYADGDVEFPSQTAALTAPYRNSGLLAPLRFTPARMNEMVTEADRRGMIVHVHVIGNLAAKATLDAIAAARKANPAGTLPHTLAHLMFVDPEDFPRFAQLGAIASMQLLWAYADQSTNEVVKPYIDPGIYRWMYPARSLLDAGATIAGGSDWSVSSANPFLAMYQAETRGGPQGVLDPAQRMPREAMLVAYTRNAARVMNDLAEIGTLAPGKRADLVLVDRDVLTVPVEELKDAKVLWTMFGGRVVYGKGP